ncbi:MAG: hypothetical protein LBK59_06465 [Bifidobacteriaceae bacterium]|jgi:hypothetical protein|nr:hypothetical protein [Bifidobacteriaceae bacterium]
MKKPSERTRSTVPARSEIETAGREIHGRQAFLVPVGSSTYPNVANLSDNEVETAVKLVRVVGDVPTTAFDALEYAKGLEPRDRTAEVPGAIPATVAGVGRAAAAVAGPLLALWGLIKGLRA